MTKKEFLDELKQALFGVVSPESMMDSYQYYSNYIDDGVSMGKREEEVVEELGSPLLIARSIIAAQTGERAADVEYTEEGKNRKIRNRKNTFKEHTTTEQRKEIHFDVNAWYAKVLFVLFLVAMAVIIFALLSGFLWFAIHFAIPVLLVLGIIYLIMYALR